MQKCIRYTFCARELWLMYNAAAMFEVTDIVGGTDKLDSVQIGRASCRERV